ncbi:MAG: S8 family serine peptidase [Thermoleophilaceae bacterium]
MRERSASSGRLAAAIAAALVVLPAAALGAFPAGPPDDPLFDASPLPNATNEQWDLASPSGGFDRGISADRAWRLTRGEGALIADVDVGVDLGHPDLAGQWAGGGRDFYDGDDDPTADTGNTHGTNVAGVLAAEADNGIGIAGVAPGARILALRTADNILHQGDRVARAIVYAADRGADAISMSLGADSFPASLRRAVAYADRKGAVPVVAMGNEFHFHHHQPQMLDQALAVGGLNPDTANLAAQNENLALAGTRFDVLAAYSDYGAHIDVVAPTQVPTTQLGGGYVKTWSGTSAATPHVAGVVALVAARGRELGLGLSAEEIRQIVRMTADDVGGPGWNRHTGWGRVNAYEAAQAAAPGSVPPETNLTAPGWYRPVRGGIDVRALVRGRSATTWELEIGRGVEPASWRRLAAGAARGRQRLARIGAGRLEPGPWTLRLRALDADGNRGEDRVHFRVLGDPSLEPGFPRRLGSSGESSPQPADLDGDGAAEIVLATSDGVVRVYRGGRPWRRWREPAAFLATPAVGDVAGGPAPEIVAAGLDGRVYAWNARGRRVPGFPVRIDERGDDDRLDRAIYASPALADLDGDGRLDIVAAGADQKVYAWDGRGQPLPGWPVLARDRAGGDVAKILSSPAIGDIDGDGSPDIVHGTGEAYGSTPLASGRVYAWDAGGRLLPGWPVKPGALVGEALPLVGEGVPMSPLLADVDGDGRDEVAVAAFTGRHDLYRGDGTMVTSYATPGTAAFGANAAFGRTAPGGPLRLFGGLIDLRIAAAQLLPASQIPFDHLFGGWDARSGGTLPGFPLKVEGWQIASAPAIADVDGDGRSELLAGSSGNRLHAFREDGTEPAGWPKETEGWLLASPAVGDTDGDGRREVVAVTRDGWLFAWDTPAQAGAPADWPSFRHDPRNTGRHGGAPLEFAP